MRRKLVYTTEGLSRACACGILLLVLAEWVKDFSKEFREYKRLGVVPRTIGISLMMLIREIVFYGLYLLTFLPTLLGSRPPSHIEYHLHVWRRRSATYCFVYFEA